MEPALASIKEFTPSRSLVRKTSINLKSQSRRNTKREMNKDALDKLKQYGMYFFN